MLGLAAATGAPALLLICGCCGLVEPSRQPSDGSEPSTDHSRYELEPQDQVAGGRWLLHVGGSRGLLPGLESATAKISGSGRSGVPPNMSTWCIPSGMARGAAQPEHDMARPALQHHPTHGISPCARQRAITRPREEDPRAAELLHRIHEREDSILVLEPDRVIQPLACALQRPTRQSRPAEKPRIKP